MRRFILATALAMTGCLAAPLAAQATAAPAATEPSGMEAAKAALDRMSARLNALAAFEIDADSTTEEVFRDGEKLQFINRVKYVVSGPSQFYASVRSDRQFRRYFYDGKTVTIVAPHSGYYATAPLTGTTASIIKALRKDYDVEIPLADLFFWKSGDPEMPVMTDAFLVGYAQIGEVATDQWFFRFPGADVQLWIGRDDALPRRMVISNTEDDAQPQYTANLSWNITPKIAADRFTFTPGERNSRIPLTADAVRAAATGGQ